MLKATAEHLRERPDLAHVWRNIDTPAEMRDAWESLNDADHRARRTPASWCRRTRRPGVPVAIRTIEDPLFGPVVSFGIAGPLTELLEDRSYRIPPLAGGDAAAMVREIKASPMLFGYRGSEVVDVAEVERLILRVAQLQNDLPQVSVARPARWCSPAPTARRCSPRPAGSTRCSTRARTGSSAGCRGPPGDTLAGLSRRSRVTDCPHAHTHHR